MFGYLFVMSLIKQDIGLLNAPEPLLLPMFKSVGYWQSFKVGKGEELRCVFERVSPLVRPIDDSLGQLGRTHIAYSEARVRSMLRNKAYATSDRINISNSFASYPSRQAM